MGTPNSNSNRNYWLDKLSKSNTYTIPKKKSAANSQSKADDSEKPILEPISTSSREYGEIMSYIKNSYQKRSESTSKFEYTNVKMINNEKLNKDFDKKRREMKTEGYSETHLGMTYAFLQVFSQKQAEEIANRGLQAGDILDGNLGDPHKGVHLCKFADVLSSAPLMDGSFGILMVFQVIKGKSHAVSLDSRALDPTPMADSHVPNVASYTNKNDRDTFLQSRMYLYEYRDFELNCKPRTVKPLAVMNYSYTQKSSAYEHRKDRHKTEHILWQGSVRFEKAAGLTQYLPDVRLMSLYARMKIFELPRSLGIKCLVPLEVVMQWSAIQELARTGMLSKRREVTLRRGRNNGQIASYWRFAPQGDRTVQTESKLGQLTEHMRVSNVAGISVLRGYSKLVLFPTCEMSAMLGIPSLPDHAYGLHCLLVSYRSPTAGLTATGRDIYETVTDSKPKLTEQLRPDNQKLWHKFACMHPPSPDQMATQLQTPEQPASESGLSSANNATDLDSEINLINDVDMDVDVLPNQNTETDRDKAADLEIEPEARVCDIDERRMQPPEKAPEKPAEPSAGKWVPLTKSIRDPRIQKRVNSYVQRHSDSSSISTVSGTGLGIVEPAPEQPGGAVHSDVTDISYQSSHQDMHANILRPTNVSDIDSLERPASPTQVANAIEALQSLRTIPLESCALDDIDARSQQGIVDRWKRVSDAAVDADTVTKKPRHEEPQDRPPAKPAIMSELQQKLQALRTMRPVTAEASAYDVAGTSKDFAEPCSPPGMEAAVIRLDGTIDDRGAYISDDEQAGTSNVIQEPVVTSTTHQVGEPTYTVVTTAAFCGPTTHTINTQRTVPLHTPIAKYRIPPDSALIDNDIRPSEKTLRSSRVKVKEWILKENFAIIPPASPSLHSHVSDSEHDENEDLNGVENQTNQPVFSAADLWHLLKSSKSNKKRHKLKQRLAFRTGPLAGAPDSPNLDDFDDDGNPVQQFIDEAEAVHHDHVAVPFSEHIDENVAVQNQFSTLELLNNLNQNTVKVADWLNSHKENVGYYDEAPATPHTPANYFNDDLDSNYDGNTNNEQDNCPISPRSDDEIYNVNEIEGATRCKESFVISQAIHSRKLQHSPLDSRKLFRQAMANLSHANTTWKPIDTALAPLSPEDNECEDQIIEEVSYPPQQVPANNQHLQTVENNKNDAELWDEIMVFPEIIDAQEHEPDGGYIRDSVNVSPSQQFQLEDDSELNFMPSRFRRLNLIQCKEAQKINEVVTTVLDYVNEDVMEHLGGILPALPDSCDFGSASDSSDQAEKYMKQLEARRMKQSILRSFEMNSLDIIEECLLKSKACNESSILDSLKMGLLFRETKEIPQNPVLNKVDGLNREHFARFAAECQLALMGSLHRRVTRNALLEMASFETSLSHVCSGQGRPEAHLCTEDNEVTIQSDQESKLYEIVNDSSLHFDSLVDSNCHDYSQPMKIQESIDTDAMLLDINCKDNIGTAEMSESSFSSDVSTKSVTLRSISCIANELLEQVCKTLRFEVAEYFFFLVSINQNSNIAAEDNGYLGYGSETSFTLCLSASSYDLSELGSLKLSESESYPTDLEMQAESLVSNMASQNTLQNSDHQIYADVAELLDEMGDVIHEHHELTIADVYLEEPSETTVNADVVLLVNDLLDEVCHDIDYRDKLYSNILETDVINSKSVLHGIIAKSLAGSIDTFEANMDEIWKLSMPTTQQSSGNDHVFNDLFPFTETFQASHKKTIGEMGRIFPDIQFDSKLPSLQFSSIMSNPESTMDEYYQNVDALIESQQRNYEINLKQGAGIDLEKGLSEDMFNQQLAMVLDDMPTASKEDAPMGIVDEMLAVQKDAFTSELGIVQEHTIKDIESEHGAQITNEILDKLFNEETSSFFFNLDKSISNAASGIQPAGPLDELNNKTGQPNYTAVDGIVNSVCADFETNLVGPSSNDDNKFCTPADDSQMDNDDMLDDFIIYNNEVKQEPWPYLMWQHLKRNYRLHVLSPTTMKLFSALQIQDYFVSVDTVVSTSVLSLPPLEEVITVQEEAVRSEDMTVDPNNDSDASLHLVIDEPSIFPSSVESEEEEEEEEEEELAADDLQLRSYYPDLECADLSGKIPPLTYRPAVKLTKKRRSLYIGTDLIARALRRTFLQTLDLSFASSAKPTRRVIFKESTNASLISETDDGTDYPETIGSFSDTTEDDFGLRTEYSMIVSSDPEEDEASAILRGQPDSEEPYWNFHYKHLIGFKPSRNIHKLKHDRMYKNYEGPKGKGIAAVGSDFRNGILVPDDMVFIRAAAGDVQRVLEAFMLWQQNGTGDWTLKLHSQVVLALAQSKKNLNPTSASYNRLTEILQHLVRFRKTNTVDLMGNHECDSTSRPAQEYLPCLISLAQQHGPNSNIVFLTNLSLSSEAAKKYLDNNITVLSLVKFIEVVVDRMELHEPSPATAPPIVL